MLKNRKHPVEGPSHHVPPSSFSCSIPRALQAPLQDWGLCKAVSQAGRGHPDSVRPGFEPAAEAWGRGGSRRSLPRIVSPLPPALLREEVAQLQEEVHLLRQMKEMLTKDLEETHGSKSPEVLSATELKVQLAQKEQELARAKEALQGKGCASPFSHTPSPGPETWKK